MLSFLRKTEQFLLRIIEKIENQKITLNNWLIGFLSIVFLRLLLESFSSKMNFFQKYSSIIHATGFFFFWILVIVLLLYIFTKEKIEKISKLALFAFLIILLPPIVDLIVTGGKGGIRMHYIDLINQPKNVLDFLKLFGKFIFYGYQGIFFVGKHPDYLNIESLTNNYGIRIQANLIILGIIWYIFLKTKNSFKALLSFLLFHFIFLAQNIPSFYFYNFRSSYLNPSFDHHCVFFSWYFICICFLSLIWFFVYNKNQCLSLLKNLRITRTLQNIAMLGFGLYLARINFSKLQFQDWMLIIVAFLSLLFYWLAAIGYNDISDEKEDKISNPDRPLCQNKFSQEEMKNLSNIFLIISYLSAFLVGYFFLIFIFMRSLLGYLYNNYPFKLKRFPFLASSTKSLAYLFTIYAGFLINNSNSFFNFPKKLAWFIFFAFTLGVNIKDIKDYEGDKSAKIYTIPVIFGLDRGKKIIAVLTSIPFFLVPIFFLKNFNKLIFPSVLTGILIYWLIIRKNYNEKLIFLIYFIYGIFLSIVIFN